MKTMMNLEIPIFTGQDVCRIARIDMQTLANWLRRGLLDRLHSSRAAGQHRRYTAVDVLTIAAAAELHRLGLTPSAAYRQDRFASLILSNAAHRYHSRKGVWGEIRPGTEDMYRWLVIVEQDGFMDWTTCSHPEQVMQATARGAAIVVDCHAISDHVTTELENIVGMNFPSTRKEEK